jgi:hypothetical protein
MLSSRDLSFVFLRAVCAAVSPLCPLVPAESRTRVPALDELHHHISGYFLRLFFEFLTFQSFFAFFCLLGIKTTEKERKKNPKSEVRRFTSWHLDIL